MGTHYNPIGWGCLDDPDCLTACGKRVAQVAGWTGNPDNATCKKCNANTRARSGDQQSLDYSPDCGRA